MRGSLKIFTWLGIPTYLHPTFFLIPLLIVGAAFIQHWNPIELVFFSVAIFFLFLSVLLHEYGHAMMGRYYGISTRDIILTPLGGLARLEQMPEKPAQEFWVALAGPFVNVIIAGLLWLLCKFVLFAEPAQWEFFKLYMGDILSQSEQTSPEVQDFIEETGITIQPWKSVVPIVMGANIMLVLFNLIPAFPLDGGRVLRALLSLKFQRVEATRIASTLGQIMAVGFVIIGLLNGPISLTLIGFVLFSMARSENQMVWLESVLKQYKVSEITRQEYTVLQSNDWMQTPVNLLHRGLERHFLVKNLQDELYGTLHERDILLATKKRDLTADVANYTQTPLPVVDASMNLTNVYDYIVNKNRGIVQVIENGEVIGVVDEAGLEYFIRMHQPRRMF